MEQKTIERSVVNRLTDAIIGAAIEVHKYLGPGLLESTYEECLAAEFVMRDIAFERQNKIPLVYKGMKLRSELRVDFIAEKTVIIELKSVEALVPVHRAQLLTYLNLSDNPVGLLMNFNVPVLKDGIKRMINPNYRIVWPNVNTIQNPSVSLCLCGEEQ